MRCAWRSQSRLFCTTGSVPGGVDWPLPTPPPMLRTRPFSTSPGSTSSTIATGSPGSTWPMLFSVRSALIHRSCIAISVITGAPGCAKWPTSVRRSVTTPRAGATTCVRARSSSAFSTAATRAAQLRVVVARFAGGLLRLAQVGLGAAHLAARLVARGLRDLEAAHRDRAGILLVQLLQPAGVAFGHVAAGLGHRQRGPRRLDAGHRALDRTAHRFEVGARASPAQCDRAAGRCRTAAGRAAPRRCCGCARPAPCRRLRPPPARRRPGCAPARCSA